jgi:hypothetical protein
MDCVRPPSDSSLGHHHFQKILAPQLLMRVLREGHSVLLLEPLLVAADQIGPVIGREIGVERVAIPVLGLSPGVEAAQTKTSGIPRVLSGFLGCGNNRQARGGQL